ncbi:DNA mismatch repair protein MutL [Actinoplanes sp. NPDC051851]|uniref:DNA mismatch repair protein MutL n=1 Tax=Actinoplanes sp. NPDC051851 TaxID=3154753 RepID=UPI00343A15C2
MGSVRSSRWLPVAGWFAATAGSIVLSWVALLPVLNAARPDVGTLPDIDQVPAAAEVVTPVTTTSTPRPAATTAKTSPPAEKPTTAKPTTKKPAPSKATTTEDGWTVTTGDDGVRTYVRSFTVEGGQAVIRMTSEGVVSLVTATPADGYTVEKTQSDPADLAVYFNETNHSFIIRAIWWNDAPFAEVNEIGS